MSIKNRIANSDFFYFKSYLGNGVYLFIGLNLLSGILDGAGLAMFLPLFQLLVDSNELSSSSESSVAIVATLFDTLNIPFNLSSVLMVIISFFILKAVFKWTAGYYRVLLQQKFMKQIRLKNLDLLSDLNYVDFVDQDQGKVTNLMAGEVNRVSQAFLFYFQSIQFAIIVAVYSVFALISNIQFSILVFIGGAIIQILFSRLNIYSKKLSKQLTSANGEYQSLLIQQISNFKYLKATGRIVSYGRKLKMSIDKIENKQKGLGKIAILLSTLREPLVLIIVCLAIYLQVAIMGKELGFILLSLIFFYRALTYLASLQNYWNTFLSASGSLNAIQDFAKDLGKNKEQTGASDISNPEQGFTFKDMQFSYGGTEIFKDFNLHIKQNETIAFVGATGAGKTTLINILSGIIPVAPGMYVLGSTDSNDLNKRSFQNHIGYITQEPVIFNDSLFNNVTFWDEKNEENLNKFFSCLELTSLIEFCNDLTNKEDTVLGDNGISISGGQRQRVSIARELYREVSLLIMDEATSALDSNTEKIIQTNIEKLKGSTTMVLVAHRLSTIKEADRIIYLENGQVAAEGDFNTLMETSEKFNALLAAQKI